MSLEHFGDRQGKVKALSPPSNYYSLFSFPSTLQTLKPRALLGETHAEETSA